MDNSTDMIYCPFFEVSVSVRSEIIERIGSFPMFILQALFNEDGTMEPRKQLHRIIDSTKIQSSTVLETMGELADDGLLKSLGNDEYSLSESGAKYVRIARYLESFSDNFKKRIAVNAFTGMLESVKNEAWFSKKSYPDDSYVLKRNTNRLMIQNPNFSNVKDFLKDEIDLSQLSISEDDYKYIVFDLKPEKEPFFVPYVVLPQAILSGDECESHPISLIIPVEEVHRTATHKKIEENKSLLPALLHIAQTRPSFLSDAGNDLVRIAQKLECENKKDATYYECHFGYRFSSAPSFDTDWSHAAYPEFRLSKRKKKACRPQEIGDIIVTTTTESKEIRRLISFDRLEQAE